MSKIAKTKTEAGGSYSAKDIQVLTGLEPVRKRPGMYIGSTGVEGLHHLIWEVFDNSLDEAMAGYAHNIQVDLLPENKVSVADDGRGIPTDPHPKLKKSALELAATTLHAGGKFGEGAYKVSGGLHGVGLSVVNALSTWLRAEVRRKPDVFVQEYKIGKPQGPVKKVGKTSQTGTTITFQPDPTIFSEINFDWDKILTHLRQQAYLTKGVRITVNDERSLIETSQPQKKDDSTIRFLSHSFYFEGGIVSYVRYLTRHEEAKHSNIFYANKSDKDILVEAAFQYTDSIQGRELSFANNVHTIEGGMHLTGFRSAITRTLNDYGRKNNYLKDKDDNLTGEDVREGLTVVVSVKLREPQFEGQTKAKLGTPDARTVVESVINAELADWLERNPNDGRAILEKVMIAAKARTAAKAARDLVIRKSALEGMALPGKLADCTSRDPQESELFIVEGDSAGGCFSGETKVALLDGRNLSFEELVNEQNQGKKNYCYTIKKDGHVGIAEITEPRVTKKDSAVIKIVLDNDQEITCTPDHKFMLVDGTFKEAQNLSSADSLMPLYRQYSRLGKRITIEGYELVFDNKFARWIFTHMLSDQYNLERGVYEIEEGVHNRHHKDFNKLNNNPDNIVRLSRETHFELHQKIIREVMKRPEVIEKLRRTKQSTEYREKISKKMLAMRDILSARARKQWHNPEYKGYMTKKFLDFYQSNEEYRELNNKMLNESQQKYWSVSSNRQKQSTTTKSFFEKNPEAKKTLSELSKKQWSDKNLRNWRAQTTRQQWTDDFRVKRRMSYGETYRSKALATLKNILEKTGKIDSGAYQKIRLETNDKSLLKYDTILERFFENDNDRFVQAVKNYNHKIKSINKLDEKMDVYDLEVPETHNFALASGVFVHNSSKQGRNRKTQAILPLKGKILNVEKARVDKMLGHEEIRALIVALGTAISAEFDIEKIRYHKIVLMADADVDGAHIRTLLLTLFFRYFPQIIEKGYLYIAQPPLYRIQKGSNIQYAYTDTDKEKIMGQLASALAAKPATASAKTVITKKKAKGVEGFEVSSLNGNGIGDSMAQEDAGEMTDGEVGGEVKIAGVSIQRYKGLGEMNPSQLWETTMDPERRMLLKVTVADAEKADEVFDILMGSDVLPRKKFIQTHAKNVKNLDI